MERPKMERPKMERPKKAGFGPLSRAGFADYSGTRHMQIAKPGLRPTQPSMANCGPEQVGPSTTRRLSCRPTGARRSQALRHLAVLERRLATAARPGLRSDSLPWAVFRCNAVF